MQSIHQVCRETKLRRPHVADRLRPLESLTRCITSLDLHGTASQIQPTRKVKLPDCGGKLYEAGNRDCHDFQH